MTDLAAQWEKEADDLEHVSRTARERGFSEVVRATSLAAANTRRDCARQLREAQAADALDARRYRFLRETWDKPHALWPTLMDYDFPADKLDAAIDAALAPKE